MARIIPTVARILHYFPSGMRDSIMVRRTDARAPGDTNPLPLAALVVDVISENVVNLTVFDGLGATFSRVHVPVVQEGDPYSAERCIAGWCEWPKISRAPQVRDGGLQASNLTPEGVVLVIPTEPTG